MTRFHEGQPVDVFVYPASLPLERAFGKGNRWHKATVIDRIEISHYRVKFANGIRGICDADYIRKTI